ncbi:MAG: radical SAM protein [Dehalococcoidia bacterium]|uniref:radical SAM protein n=1 Tax=Candidatus Amarobacter glycogenicus TaxID=3140699 RepID=UPI003135805D|nr:radical SAM protein [Dehalococcoidia bacterium]
MTNSTAVPATLARRLWLYTNFDCNLACTYCLSSSSPRAARRAIPLEDFRRLIDEARGAGIEECFLTGGEPFLLPDIFDRLRYAAERLPTTVLTNGMLLAGARFERLRQLQPLPLTIQISLDGACADCHDAFRGRGSWAKTVAAIRALLDAGFHVAIGATETNVNRPHIEKLREFVRKLGILDEDVFVRPLTRRGLSAEGLDLRRRARTRAHGHRRRGLLASPVGRRSHADFTFDLSAGWHARRSSRQFGSHDRRRWGPQAVPLRLERNVPR